MREKEELSGYKGKVFVFLKKVEAEIGDLIRLTKNNETYEGILIPRSEYGDEEHVVIKLKTGYNIGVRITQDTEIERVRKGAKLTFKYPLPPEQNPKLPKVVIISTGGTIASRVDYRTGAVRPALTANDLYSVVPELANVALIDAQILFSLFSENVTPKRWTEIAKAVSKQISKGIDGVVVAHGTDTMGYSAAALSFALQNLPIPVILVGSQRSADRPSSDAATNLLGAVIAAAKAPFAEVAVAMHEATSDTSVMLHKGTKVRKCHTSRRDTFRSVNTAPIARVQDQRIVMLAEEYRKRDSTRTVELKPRFDEKVALIKFYPGMNPAIIDLCVEKDYRGIILEGTGLGHVGNCIFKAIRNATEHNVIVGMASQCIWGRTNMNVYDQGRDLLDLGVIPMDDMLAETATVKLMWIFGQTKSLEEAKKLLKTNIAGEFSQRTLPEESAEIEGEKLGNRL